MLQCNFKVGSLKPEKSIPDSILRQAKGLAIITVVNVGMMVTYKIGTGLVVARRADGSWSPPSAISTYGVGYGVQVIATAQVFLFHQRHMLNIFIYLFIYWPCRLEVS
mgnify:CR=1 FL=1